MNSATQTTNHMSSVACYRVSLVLAVWMTTLIPVRGEQAKLPSLEEMLSDAVFVDWVQTEKVSKCVECHLLPRPFTEPSLFSRRQEMMHWVLKDKHAIARIRVVPLRNRDLKITAQRLQARKRKGVEQAVERLDKDFYRIDESKIDRNTISREWIGLSNVLSRRICDKLWPNESVDTEAGYDNFRQQCLNCHGGSHQDASAFDRLNLDTSGTAQIGIDCLYCHQEGSSNEWIAQHNDPKWRTRPPAEKTGLGMRDLVNVPNQARLCFDCHIGNRKRGLFVTHEMYAAGHPPLPPIELQTFCEQMPQHWQTPRELYQSLKGYEKRDEYFAVNYPGITKAVSPEQIFWNARKVLIGGLQAKQHILNLLVDSATPQRWADYSLYDCAACHHSLRSGSLRQHRYVTPEVSLAPGRPRPHEWTRPLLRVANHTNQANGSQPTQGLHDQLMKCFNDRPFGDAARTASAAQQWSRQLGEVIVQAQSTVVVAEHARQLLEQLSATPWESLVTYDAARQLVWAIQIIGGELTEMDHPLSPAAMDAIANLGNRNLSGVRASLPAGRAEFIYPESLAADVNARAGYDPQRFINVLAELRESLAADDY